MLKIGDITLENNLILAPMAGVTDLPFRILCKEQGCGLVYSEMISAKGLYYNNKNTEILMKIDESERPVAIQLFGSDPELLAKMAKKIENHNLDIIDINMGCPVPKVVNNGEGSGLMRNPDLIARIVDKVANSINKPLTIKIRKGFNDNEVNAVQIAKIAEQNGAAAVAVHGRTREQYYSGKADLDIIKMVKEEVKIPVIGNGDIFTPQDAKRMLEYTKCDGLMIARGAEGNPWIFNEINHYLKYGEIIDKPTARKKVEKALEHAVMLLEFKGEYTGIREMRKHVGWYLKGLYNTAEMRNKINYVENYNQLEEILLIYLEENNLLGS